MRILAALSILIALSGCISKNSGVVDAEKRQWQKGVTSRRDIVQAWGNPDFVRGREWTWKASRMIGSKVEAAYKMVGITVVNSQVSTLEYRFTFDDDWKVKDVVVAESLPGGASWSMNPL